jgi:hypothetical protein
MFTHIFSCHQISFFFVVIRVKVCEKIAQIVGQPVVVEMTTELFSVERKYPFFQKNCSISENSAHLVTLK